jgi:phosphoribosylanthranilate isomerase
MTDVKICGITNLEDGLAASEWGADALGFIFHPGSPRYLLPETAAEIIGRLPQHVVKVGVFVKAELSELRRIFRLCGLDYVQLHGNETGEYCRHIPAGLMIKAVHLKTAADLEGFDRLEAKALLVDSMDPVRYGGTGRLSDWDLAAVLARRRPVILAGGLGPENVADAIRDVSPTAVDAVSGVERAPGKKDHSRMKRFIQEAKAVTGSGAGGLFLKLPSCPSW